MKSNSVSNPRALGGDDGPGANPEQLFAAGCSACFISAMQAVAARQKASLPGIDRAAAQTLVTAAHEVSPYSKATRGNADATLTVM